MEIQECVSQRWASRLQICTKFIRFATYLHIPIETVYLAVNCLDRFLSVRVVSEYHLDVIGATIFAIATEFERSSIPSVFELDSSLAERYQPEDVPFVKATIVDVLENSLKTPSPFVFLRRISTADAKVPNILPLAQYLSTCSLLDERYVGIEPSRIAAAAYHLALRIIFTRNRLQLDWVRNYPTAVTGANAVVELQARQALWVQGGRAETTNGCVVEYQPTGTKHHTYQSHADWPVSRSSQGRRPYFERRSPLFSTML